MRKITDIIDEERKLAPLTADPLVFHLVAEILLLAEELCVARDRLETALKLSANGARVDRNAIDGYAFSEEDLDSRLARHTAFYEEIYNRLCDLVGVSK